MRLRIKSMIGPQPQRRIIYLILLMAASSFIGYAMIGDLKKNEPTSETARPLETAAAQQQGDFSRFFHTNATHSRMPCLLCHRRDDNSGRIGFPGKGGHTPCIGCHQQQFAQGSGGKICTICHTNAENGAMKSFPHLQDFTMRFDHSKHAGTNCATCHQSSRQGVAFSIPSGRGAHDTCFKCHTAYTSNQMASCSTCHTLGSFVRTPETARAFQVNFSHARHRQAGMNCTSCHTVQAGTARGRQVTAPLASMHFAPTHGASCAACHNGTRAFGANDFANCKRCHVGNKFTF